MPPMHGVLTMAEIRDAVAFLQTINEVCESLGGRKRRRIQHLEILSELVLDRVVRRVSWRQLLSSF